MSLDVMDTEYLPERIRLEVLALEEASVWMMPKADSDIALEKVTF